MGVRRVRLPLASLQADENLHGRCGVDPLAVERYADALKAGEEFPGVVVFGDGTRYLLADGFLRLEAHKLLKRPNIFAYVYDGGEYEALAFSVFANGSHGLQRSTDDCERCVILLCNSPHYRHRPNSEIARMARVPEVLVNRVRRQLAG